MITTKIPTAIGQEEVADVVTITITHDLMFLTSLHKRMYRIFTCTICEIAA